MYQDQTLYLSINQEKQQQINRSLVIDLLRQERLCSRADLADLTGLRRATITNIINEFIENELVIEDGILNGKKGRRSIGIRINGEKFQTIGVMVTRQYYQIGLFALSGETITSEIYKIPKGETAPETIDQIKKNIHTLLNGKDSHSVLAIGLAVPGPYQKLGDEIIFVTNLIGWDGISVFSAFQQDFSIPVFIENDANAGVCAQQWYRYKKSEQQSLVYVVAGQGIGCGIISGGELMKGHLGIAGEIGHTSINFDGPQCECGNHGCLEKYCSTIAIVEHIHKQIQLGRITCLKENCTIDDIANAVRIGDALAVSQYKQACEFLSIGIVNMINQINPEIVIIGDRMAEIAPEFLLEIIKEKIQQIVRPLVWNNLKIEINLLEENPIFIGAGVIAAQNVFKNPFKYVKNIDMNPVLSGNYFATPND